MSSHQETKRFRIQKLCDNCRLKKIKCDGNEVCRNCANYQATCTYNHVPKKRKLKLKPLHTGTSASASVEKKSTLENRVANVEVMLAQILELVTKKAQTPRDVVVPPPPPVPMSDTNVATLQQQQPKLEQQEVVTASGIHITDDVTNSVFVSTSKEHYFGTHSSFSIFSPKGVKWIASKITNDTDTMRFYQFLQLQMKEGALRSHDKWISPIETADLSPLPTLDQFKVLLKAICATTLHIDLDLEEEEMLNLYKRGERETLSHSDSLLLNVICCLGMPLVSDFYHINEEFKMLADQHLLDSKSLTLIEERCYTNCIFYYHRLSVIGDGSNTIRSLLLLLAYTELSFNTDALYMIVSTAVRLAQEAGLHRFESYIGLDPREAYKRIMLFSHCYLVDKAISLRSGKPPILNDKDISSIGADRFREYWYYSNVDWRVCKIDTTEYLESVSKPLRPKTALQLAQMREKFKSRLTDMIKEDISPGVSISVKFYFLELMEISSKAYDELFSAQLLLGKTALEVQATVSLLNKDLDDWFDSVPDILKADVRSDINQICPLSLFDGTSDNFLACQSLFTQLQYHFVHMTINRMSSNNSWVPTDDMDAKKRTTSSIDLCLESARLLIKLSQRIDTRATQFFKYCLFFPFCAFVTLFCACLRDLTLPQVSEDLKLMIRVVHIFTECAEMNSNSKLVQVSRLVKFLSILALGVFEKAHPGDKTFSNAYYQKLFNDMQTEIDTYVANFKKKKKQKRHVNTQSSNPANRHLKDPSLTPQLFLQQDLMSDIPMVTSHSEATNPSPSSTSSNTNIFGDLLDDSLFDNFGQPYNYFNQNLFNLPNFMLDGGSTINGGTEATMDLFEF